MVVKKRSTSGSTNALPGVVLAAVLLVAASAGFSAPLASPGGESSLSPRPFDPPSDAERATAAAVALENASVQDVLGERYVLLGVALGTQKVPGVPAAQLPRLLDVWIYDYTSDATVHAVVQPALAAVVDGPKVDATLHMPLAAVEVERAHQLALGLHEVADRFPAPLPVAANLASGEGSPCPQQRCAVIAFIEEYGPVAETLVLVNLSQDRAVRVLDGWSEVSA